MPVKDQSVVAAEPDLYDGPAAEDTAIETPKPVPPKHNPRTLAEAYELGMSKEEIDQYTPSRLADVVYGMNKQLRAAHRQISKADARDADLERARNPEPVVQVEPEDDFPLKDADFDDGLKNFLRKQHEENKSLKAKAAQFEEREKVREMKTVEDVIDAAFDGLGADYESLTGSGGVRDLPADETGLKAKKRRHAILGVAVNSGLNLKTASPRQVAKAIREAAETIYEKPKAKMDPEEAGGYADVIGDTGDRQITQRKPLAKDPETGKFLTRQQTEQLEADLEYATTTARPTHRKGTDDPNGVQKATRNLANRLRETRPGDSSDTGHATKEDFL